MIFYAILKKIIGNIYCYGSDLRVSDCLLVNFANGFATSAVILKAEKAASSSEFSFL